MMFFSNRILLILQVEFYFSDSNLPRDGFLRRAVEESQDGRILYIQSTNLPFIMIPKLSMIMMHSLFVFSFYLLSFGWNLWCLSLVKLGCVDSALVLFFNYIKVKIQEYGADSLLFAIFFSFYL